LGGPFFDDTQLGLELRKYQDLVSPLQEMGDESVQEKHLSGSRDERLVNIGRFICPRPVEIVWGIASQTGLQDRVLHLLLGNFFLCGNCQFQY
jgi:hypothetical protein